MNCLPERFVSLESESMSSDIDEFDDTSTFENKAGLAEDMRFLASIPEVFLFVLIIHRGVFLFFF